MEPDELGSNSSNAYLIYCSWSYGSEMYRLFIVEICCCWKDRWSKDELKSGDWFLRKVDIFYDSFFKRSYVSPFLNYKLTKTYSF